MKPILFNTEMVKANLDGRKTATRRLIKAPVLYSVSEPPSRIFRDGDMFQFLWNTGKTAGGFSIKPPYLPGDILYVRETWSKAMIHPVRYLYKTNCPEAEGLPLKWHPSIHMPKEAARIFLRVIDVQVERLQKSFNEPTTPILAVQEEGVDIGDTCRECIEAYGWPCCVDALDEDGSTIGECGMLDEARGDFSDLWDSTIKPADHERYGWNASPWVWVIEYERITREAAYGN